MVGGFGQLNRNCRVEPGVPSGVSVAPGGSFELFTLTVPFNGIVEASTTNSTAMPGKTVKSPPQGLRVAPPASTERKSSRNGTERPPSAVPSVTAPRNTPRTCGVQSMTPSLLTVIADGGGVLQPATQPVVPAGRGKGRPESLAVENAKVVSPGACVTSCRWVGWFTGMRNEIGPSYRGASTTPPSSTLAGTVALKRETTSLFPSLARQSVGQVSTLNVRGKLACGRSRTVSDDRCTTPPLVSMTATRHSSETFVTEP